MEQTIIPTQSPTTSAPKAKPKAKKVEVSPMRKLTAQLDDTVRKVEETKSKITKLQESVSAGNERIKNIMAQLAKNITT